MTLYQLWDPTVQFQSRSGKNLVNGHVKVTYADRTTVAPVYDAAGTVIQNPVTLDENGRAACYGEVGLHYVLHVYDQSSSLLYTQSVQPFPYDTDIVQKTTQLTSSDGSIALTESTVGYDVAVSEDIQNDIQELTRALHTETLERIETVAAAKTELTAGANVTLSKTTGSKGQDIYTVSATGSSGSSNVCVIQYGDTSKSLDDLKQYDTVLMQMNTKTFYMTELTDTTAHFMSCYRINSTDCIETCDYDGTAWSDVSTVDMDSNVLVVSEGDTLDYATLKKYDAVFLSRAGNLLAVMTYLDTSRAIFTSFTTRYRGTLMATDIPTLTYSFSAATWTTSYLVSDYTLCIVTYGSSTTFNEVMAFIGAGGTCALSLGFCQFAYLTNNVMAATSVLQWTRYIDGKMETYSLTNSNEWSMTTTDTATVAVSAGETPSYLEDAIVSDSDMISLVKADGKLHVQVNTAESFDPKLQTMDEFAINTATSNYGAYALNTGYEQLIWQDVASYSYCNAIVYQSTRIATSQGVITKCNLALTGNLSGTAPCFNVGIFRLSDGALLGSTGLIFPQNGTMLSTLNMYSVFDDALNLKRNTRYVIQVWSCGCQLAAYSHGTSYNYSYDYTLKQNLQSGVNAADWLARDSASFARADTVPYLNFGASSIE